MASPKADSLRLEVQEGQNTVKPVVQDGRMSITNASKEDPDDDVAVRHAIAAIEQYLTDNAPVYRELQQLRAKVSDHRAILTFALDLQRLVSFLTVKYRRAGKTPRATASSRGSDVRPTTATREVFGASKT